MSEVCRIFDLSLLAVIDWWSRCMAVFGCAARLLRISVMRRPLNVMNHLQYRAVIRRTPGYFCPLEHMEAVD